MRSEEAALTRFLSELSETEKGLVRVERLARFEPVTFDAGIVAEVERATAARNLTYRRMTSGAGDDAQMMARIAPSAMTFVQSIGGISHNPKEFTPAPDLVAGENILLDVVRKSITSDAAETDHPGSLHRCKLAK